MWPATATELLHMQDELAALTPPASRSAGMGGRFAAEGPAGAAS
jgi:hypothetical protein